MTSLMMLFKPTLQHVLSVSRFTYNNPVVVYCLHTWLRRATMLRPLCKESLIKNWNVGNTMHLRRMSNMLELITDPSNLTVATLILPSLTA
jgi:hypothetical protein